MKQTSEEKLHAEEDTWLNRGRRELINALLRRHGVGYDLSILEIGAGGGGNVPTLLEFGKVDVNECSDIGLEKLGQCPSIDHVIPGTLPDLVLEKQYDLICAMDVFEHIQDDQSAAKWVRDHLKPGGFFLATVPAYQWLYSDHDRANMHFRRYTKGRLNGVLMPYFDVLHSGYFNTFLFPLAAASRLVWELKNNVSNAENQNVEKQSSRVHPFLDKVFSSVLGFENYLIKKGCAAPFGLTAYSLCRKREEPSCVT